MATMRYFNLVCFLRAGYSQVLRFHAEVEESMLNEPQRRAKFIAAATGRYGLKPEDLDPTKDVYLRGFATEVECQADYQEILLRMPGATPGIMTSGDLEPTANVTSTGDVLLSGARLSRLVREVAAGPNVVASLGQLIWPAVASAMTDADPRPYRTLWYAVSDLLLQNTGEDADKTSLFAYMQAMSVATYWAHHNFSLLQIVGHKYAAELCFTTMPEVEVGDEIRPPWPAFAIELPDGVIPGVRHIYVANHDFAHDEGDVPVSARDLRWSVTMFQKVDNSVLYDWNLTPAAFFADNKSNEDAVLDDTEQRTLLMIRRLVASVCLRFADPDAPPRASGTHLSGGRKRKGGAPEIRKWQIGRPVTLDSGAVIDCRDAVRDFLAGKHAPTIPTVQTLVRGFWRNQPHGPRQSLRRRQWIAPFWRGPDDAPIVVRTTRLRDDA